MTHDQASPEAGTRRPAAIPPAAPAGDETTQDGDDLAVDSIPGLGPIRARALKKAGFRTLSLLRAASTADLMAVPGMTGVKAAQLSAYLRGEADRVGGQPAPKPAPKPAPPPEAKPVRRASAPRAETPRPRATKTGAPKAMPEPTPVLAAFGDPPFVAAARRVAENAGALLRGETSSEFDRSFARQLGKMAALAERIGHESAESTHHERAIGQLQKAEQLLEEIAAAGHLGQKRQDRFADALRERRQKLQDALDAKLIVEAGAGPDGRASDDSKARNNKSDKKSRRGR
jgi:hypothetical protein